MRRLHKYEFIRILSFAIFLAFIALAFTVEASEVSMNQNLADLRQIVDPRDSDPRTLVPLDPLRPWAMTTKRDRDFERSTGKLPTYEYMELKK